MQSIDESIKYIIESSEVTDIKGGTGSSDSGDSTTGSGSSISEMVTSISTFSKLGQYYGSLAANTNVLNLLNTKYANTAPESYTYTVVDLTYFRIQFNSEPYLIYDNNGTLTIVKSASKYKNLVSGYIVYINNEPIIVKGDLNYYELKDSDTAVTSVIVPVASDVTIDYVCRIRQAEISGNTTEDGKVYKKIYYYETVGQLWGVFEANESLITRIKNKYSIKGDNYIRQLSTVNSVTIEAEPGTIVYVKDSFDDTVYKHVISKNGVLKLDNEDATIEELYFAGTEIDDSFTIDSLNAIILGDEDNQPEIEGLYEDNNTESTDSISIVVLSHGNGTEEEIYLTGVEDLSTRPVSALVDYDCEIMEVEF